jgi:hypothetical protein
MQNGGNGDDDGAMATPGAAAAYIASLTEELAQLARRHGLGPLGHILEMARMEADQVAKSTNGTEP